MISMKQFLLEEMAKPFAWSLTDCCSTADRRVEQVAGFSPLALFGRRYASEAEAQAWLDECGGLPVAVNRVMRNAGFRKVDTPRENDVGLAFFDTRIATAIWTGDIWFSRDVSGFLGAPCDRAWKIWRIA